MMGHRQKTWQYFESHKLPEVGIVGIRSFFFRSIFRAGSPLLDGGSGTKIEVSRIYIMTCLEQTVESSGNTT